MESGDVFVSLCPKTEGVFVFVGWLRPCCNTVIPVVGIGVTIEKSSICVISLLGPGVIVFVVRARTEGDIKVRLTRNKQKEKNIRKNNFILINQN